MVRYTQDGRRVYMTSVNPDEPGVYMVENFGGVDEPYTGDVADLRVTPPQREKTTDPVKLAFLAQLDPHPVDDRLKLIRELVSGYAAREVSQGPRNYTYGYSDGRIELAQEIMDILKD